MAKLVEISRSFGAMSTGVEAVACAPRARRTAAEQALDRVQELFAETERRCSRFHAESELSRLNRAAGRDFKASPQLCEIVATALDMARLTGGIFDPIILNCLTAAGYDRSFELLGAESPAPTAIPGPPRHNWQDIQLNPETFIIRLPDGCGLDLGGIAKGWAADKAGAILAEFGGCAVNAGGDIVVRGTQADGSPWSIGIEDPRRRQDNIGVISLADAAVSTTSTTQRQWGRGRNRRHHLIDPRTGNPATSGVISATVVAPTAALAETLAKAALILGPEDGLKLLEEHRPAAVLLVLEDGQKLASAGFPALRV